MPNDPEPPKNDTEAKLAPAWRDVGLDPDFVRAVNELTAIEDHVQLAKWGYQIHSPAEWLAIATEEFGEAAKEVVELHFASTPEARHRAAVCFEREMIQTVTLLLKMGQMARRP